MKYLNYKPIANTDTTQSVTSDPIDLSQIYKLSVQIVVGAGSTMTGSIQLQVSNDEVNAFYAMRQAPNNWSDLGSATALSAAGTNYLIAAQDMCYRALRVVYTGDPANDAASVTVNLMALAF